MAHLKDGPARAGDPPACAEAAPTLGEWPAGPRRAPADSPAQLLRRMGKAAGATLVTAQPPARGGPIAGGVACPLCGHTTARELFGEPVPGSGGRTLAQCDGCRLVRLHPLPRPEELPRLYADEYYGTDNAKFGPLTELFVLLFRLARVRALWLVGVRRGAVLDVGCARGMFLRALARLGYSVWGTELSPASAAGALRFFPDRIRIGPLTACDFAPEQFDAITAWQVFEHLQDPRETLAECRRILRPGGALILSVPNIASWQARWAGTEWFHLDLPRHLFHYTPATLAALLHAEDFEVVRLSHFGLEQNPFGLLQSALDRLGARRMGLYALLRGPLDPGQGRRRLERLPAYAAYLATFPVAAAVESFWSAVHSGATMTVLARRRP